MTAKPSPAMISTGPLSLCLDQAPLPMATVEGATHIVRYVNPAFCSLMSSPADHLIGKPLSELLPEKDHCVALVDRVVRTGMPVNHTEKDASKTHPVFWSFTMWPVLSEERLAGVMIQVTESTQVHESTVAMNEALLLGSLRQHELTEAAERQNIQMRGEIAARQKTARELAEKARLLDLTHDAILVRDLEGRISYWNHGAEELYGWSSEEVLGKHSEVLFQTGYPMALEQISGELHRTGRWTGELIHTRRDGKRITVLARKTLDRDSDGNPSAVLQTITDITERKRADEALREAGERFRFMAESMPQKIFTASPGGEVNYVNRQWTEFTGLTYAKMLDGGWLNSLHPHEIEENARRWSHSLETGETFEFEHRFRRRDGVHRWHLSRAYAMRNAEGKIALWIGSSTDIDDMMRAQEELMDAEAQLADRALQLERLVGERTGELAAAHSRLLEEAEERKRLEAEIAGAIESERERLGQELHDGLVQELTGIAMLLHVLEHQLMKPAPEYAREAGRLCLMLEQAHGKARDLAKSFYPVELEQHGLLVALEGIAHRARQQPGVTCQVQAGPDAAAGGRDATSVQLFRIAQEAVRNALRHAHAKKIVIHLSRKSGVWLLTVRDDGAGLPEGALEAGGMGMRIMQYRARIIKGTFSVRNAAGGGVIVSCSAPAGPP